jgi:hypothetical protein
MKTITTYTFGLFDSHDQLIDQTNIDENDAQFAWQLFVEFSAHESYKDINSDTAQYHVELIEEVPEEVEDDHEV